MPRLRFATDHEIGLLPANWCADVARDVTRRLCRQHSEPAAIMFIRFGIAVFLAVLVSLCATALEKQNLALRRSLARQTYRRDALRDQFLAHRATACQLGAPLRMVQQLPADELQSPQKARSGGKPNLPRRGKRA